VLFMVGCGIGSVARAEVKILGVEDPLRAEIIAAASEFWNRVADGDGDGARELFAGEGVQAELLGEYMEWVGAFERLREALPGKPEDLPRELYFSELVRGRAELPPGRLVIVNGSRASLAKTGGTFDSGMRLVRRGEEWKVTHLTGNAAEVGLVRSALKGWLGVVRAVEAEVVAGRAKTGEQAAQAMRKAAEPKMMELFGIAPPRTAAAPPLAESPKWQTPTVAELMALPGTVLPSERYDRLMASLPGIPSALMTERMLEVFDDEAGLTLNIARVPQRAVGSVTLHARGDSGSVQYPGELPHGLTFSDTRAAVEKKLGRPPASSSWLGYFSADYPTLGLSIRYPEAAGRDGTITICQILVFAPDPMGEEPEKGPARPQPRLAFRWVAPEGAGKGADVELLPDLSDPGAAPLPVLREVLLDGRDVARVFPTQSRQGEFVIGLELTQEGARRMTALTTANIGRRLAVVVDGQIVFAPAVRGVISNSMVIDYGRDGEVSMLRKTLSRMQTAIFSLP
jgi:hypothetical protein